MLRRQDPATIPPRPASPVDVHRLQERKCSPSNQSARPGTKHSGRNICMKNSSLWKIRWLKLRIQGGLHQVRCFASSTCGEPPFCFRTVLPAVGTLGIGFLWFHHQISHRSFWLSPLLRALTPHNRCLSTRLKPRRRFAATGQMPVQSSSQKLSKNPPSETSKQQPSLNKNRRTVPWCQTHSKRSSMNPSQKALIFAPARKCYSPSHHPASDADIFAPHGVAHSQHVGVQVRYFLTELDGAQSLGGCRGGSGAGQRAGTVTN